MILPMFPIPEDTKAQQTIEIDVGDAGLPVWAGDGGGDWSRGPEGDSGSDSSKDISSETARLRESHTTKKQMDSGVAPCTFFEELEGGGVRCH